MLFVSDCTVAITPRGIVTTPTDSGHSQTSDEWRRGRGSRGQLPTFFYFWAVGKLWKNFLFRFFSTNVKSGLKILPENKLRESSDRPKTQANTCLIDLFCV